MALRQAISWWVWAGKVEKFSKKLKFFRLFPAILVLNCARLKFRSVLLEERLREKDQENKPILA